MDDQDNEFFTRGRRSRNIFKGGSHLRYSKSDFEWSYDLGFLVHRESMNKEDDERVKNLWENDGEVSRGKDVGRGRYTPIPLKK